MEYISGPGKAHWNNNLLHDLVFIKKHLRYPFSKKTLPGTVLLTIFLILIFRMANVVFLVQAKASPLIKWIVIPLVAGVIFAVFYQYYLTLKFKSIQTPFFVSENRKLVEAFLQSQQLAIYRHPDAPEVFQILSTPIGNPKHEQREVMIFIADDKRVLVNSHFVNRKYTLSTPSGNSGKMANRLREWIKIHYPNEQTALTIR